MCRHIHKFIYIYIYIYSKGNAPSSNPWFIWFPTPIYCLPFLSLCSISFSQVPTFNSNLWGNRETKQPTTKPNQSQIIQRIFIFIYLPISLGFRITTVISSKCRLNQHSNAGEDLSKLWNVIESKQTVKASECSHQMTRWGCNHSNLLQQKVQQDHEMFASPSSVSNTGKEIWKRSFFSCVSTILHKRPYQKTGSLVK